MASSLGKTKGLVLTDAQHTGGLCSRWRVCIQARAKAVFLGAVSSHTLTFQKNTPNSISLVYVLYGFLYILVPFSLNWWFGFPHLSFMNGLILRIQISTQRNACKRTYTHRCIFYNRCAHQVKPVTDEHIPQSFTTNNFSNWDSDHICKAVTIWFLMGTWILWYNENPQEYWKVKIS